jgi:transketolase
MDVGVAESNMASIAAGMATYGKVPIISTFAAFASRRICDQVAVSICYANQNVKIIGTDPGITAELNGGTHMAVEDIGVLRSIPNILIFEPSDTLELSLAFPQLMAHPGPVYIRLYRKKVEELHAPSYKFDLYKADVMVEGTDVTLISSGIMVEEALKAGELLKSAGITADIINLHTIKPIDEKTILASARKTGAIVTCENHNVMGGLRAAVAEVVTRYYPVPIAPVGIQNINCEVGALPYLKERFGLTAGDIVLAAREAMELRD